MSDTLSSCGLSCLVSALPSTNCESLLNTTCLCPDQAYTNLVSNCILSNCTLGEQLSLKIVTSRNCNVTVLDRSGEIGVLQGILTPIQDILFFVRMANKMFRLSPWGADDTTIVLAWLLQNGFLGGGIIASRLGIGRDVWGLDKSRIIKIIQLFLAFEFLYTITLGLIKTSICFFYMRLFPERAVRRRLWATQIFIVVVVFTFLIVDVTQCQPLSWFWNRLDQNTTETGECLDINAVSWAYAIINIVLDLWMLALPATQIVGLQMALGKKIHVLTMFALGAFLTLVSCIRLKSLIVFAKTQNPTQDFYDISLWSAIELTTGVVVACLPTVRQTLARFGPNVHTIVSNYASRVSVADWTTRSNAKMNNTSTNEHDNISKQRRQHQRLSDEIPMSSFSPRQMEHNRHVSDDDGLSRTDSATSTSHGPSASTKRQDQVHIEKEV